MEKYLNSFDKDRSIKTKSNQAKMLQDVILFLRKHCKFIMKLFNPTGNFLMGRIGLARPKLSDLRRESPLKRKTYQEKLAKGKSLTEEAKLDSFSSLLTKMDEIMNNTEITVDDIFHYQKLLITGNCHFFLKLIYLLKY